jgi:hypothetical protein
MVIETATTVDVLSDRKEGDRRRRGPRGTTTIPNVASRAIYFHGLNNQRPTEGTRLDSALSPPAITARSASRDGVIRCMLSALVRSELRDLGKQGTLSIEGGKSIAGNYGKNLPPYAKDILNFCSPRPGSRRMYARCRPHRAQDHARSWTPRRDLLRDGPWPPPSSLMAVHDFDWECQSCDSP